MPVAFAVSGGADSMALIRLAARWRSSVVALVVDHGLRAESAAEASLTITRLRARGIEARCLTLSGLPGTRVQERARDARFSALIAACRALGAADLLLGHHAADQEETVSMRAGAGSGWNGLAGIPAVAFRGGIRIVRPLLGLRPERLRATLRAMDQPWIDDPSNRNRAFARVREREDMSKNRRAAAHALRREAIAVRRHDEERLAGWLADHAEWHPLGWASLDREGMEPEPVAALIRLIGGGRYRPALASVSTLVKRGGGSLGGVVFAKGGRWSDGFILFREARGCTETVAAISGTIWDRRWLFNGPTVPGARIARLGEGAHGLDARRLGCPARVLYTLPALWSADGLIGVPNQLKNGIEGINRVSFSWSGGAPMTGEAFFET